MITGTIRPPFRDHPQDSAEQIKKIITQAQQEIDALLLHKNAYSQETFLKITIEKRFLRVRDIYYNVFGQIL